jgi:hypothetical protein
MPKQKSIAQVRERVDAIAERLAGLNIDADEIPGILDEAMDVVEAGVKAAADGRLTFRESTAIVTEFGEFVDTVRKARAS